MSIEGQAFTLTDENGQQKPIATPYLDCVVIDVTPIVSRVFWGTENGYGTPVKGYPGKGQAYSPPLCFSDNGIGASSQAQEPQSTNCKACPWSKWDSSISRMTGKGIPACSSTKKIAVYVPDMGINFPFLLRIPVMSHENFKHYLSLFAGQDFDVDDVYTRVSFVHGQQGVLNFEPTSKYDGTKLWVNENDTGMIETILERKLTDQLIGRGDVVTTVAIPSLGGPAPEGGNGQLPPPPAQAPTPVVTQGSSPAGFWPAALPPQGGAAQTQPVAPQPVRRPRGRPKADTTQAQNPAPAQNSNLGDRGVLGAQAPSGFTAPPPVAPPATTAPFGMAAGSAPPNELQDSLNSAFGLPVGRK